MTRRSVTLLAVVVLLVLVACAGSPGDGAATSAAPAPVDPAPPDPQAAAAAKVARGEYLVTVGGCGDCHTPWRLGPNGFKPDPTRYLSGHPEGLELPPPPEPVGPWIVASTGTNTVFAGPWGVSYASNLTPEETTGLGVWTEEIFVNAMRTGRHWGQSRPILPPMPWASLGKMTDEDLSAIYAYLRTVPPQINHVPDAIVHPPPAPAP